MTWSESDHPRHPKGSEIGGQFAPKGIVDAVRGAAGVTTGLLGKLETDGGFSESLDGQSPSGGYMVALDKNAEAVYDSENLTDADILDFVMEHYDPLNKPDAYLGGWLDTDEGKVYLDVSFNIQDRDEALAAAAEADQLAIYDLGSGESIYLEKEGAR